jgi:acetyltransferase-like isoleucine patch superfamily enzyme
MKKIITKALTVVYNSIKFIGFENYFHLLAVSPSIRIEISRNGKLQVGKSFRTRFNVELNIRESSTVTIGDRVFFNTGCIITSRDFISIGDGTIFGPNVVVYDHDHIIRNNKAVDNEFSTKPVKIGCNCWIGAGTIILKGSSIGNNCVIAAGSIINGIVHSDSILIQKRENMIKSINVVSKK